MFELSGSLTNEMKLLILISSILCFHWAFCTKNVKIDFGRTKVFGPGLRPDLIVLPVRYFFIETYDANGERIRESLKEHLQVQVEGETSEGTYCRVWVQVLDRYDGTYIVRYRTYQTCLKTSIHVLYDHNHLAESPYKIDDHIYAEDCYCPLEDIDAWSETIGCPDSFYQIKKDLGQFGDVDMDAIIKHTVDRLDQPHARSFCNYVVKNNKVYRRCYGKHVGFNMFMDNILHSMARKMILPDMEFIVNLGDWPLSELQKEPLLPIFSWCGSEDTADIVMPTYDLTEATLEMMGRVMLDVFSVQSNNKIPWSKKMPIAFWRGRDSRQERLDLIELGRQHPDLINASLTNFFFFKDQEDRYGPKEKHESFYNFFNYKYQISIDGTVAAYRFPYLIAGNGVILKQESTYYEHFYHGIHPYVHYIPFKRDLSDLVEKIRWAIDNDQKAKQISDNGRRFAQENLSPKDVFCYHASLFKEWSKMITSDVKVRDQMELVVNEENQKRFGDCKCQRIKKHEEL